MFARFFRHDGNAFSFLFATQDIHSYDYTKRWAKVGNFTLTLPYDKTYVKKLLMNDFIEYDGDWLFIENISYDNRNIILSGHDCKQLVYLRISALGSFSEQFDGTTGTTAQCIEYFLNKNMISPADSVRKLPIHFESGAVGLADDGYMTKLENVGDIVEKLCNSAGIGYEVKGNLSHDYFTFQLKNTVDKSKNQSERARVIFSAERQNVTSISFEHDETNLYNAITAQGAGTLEVAYRDKDNNPLIPPEPSDPNYQDKLNEYQAKIPQGIARRECALEVNVNSIGKIRKAALLAAEDNIDTHTYNLGTFSGDYGTKFSLGDIVSVKDDATGNYFSDVITEVHFSMNAESQHIEIALGRQKPKLLNKIVKNMLNGIGKG